jgi:hypothetical protein
MRTFGFGRYTHIVSAVQVAPKFSNLLEIEDWSCHSGFNGTEWSGSGRLGVNSTRYTKTAMAVPGDWIVEISPLDFHVFDDAEFQREFKPCSP